ncbi:hypothetical protein AMAG_01899 [Allomyces macrogynus ATCC 38327]|uniref:Uncharacterized protein n=1 Tax=Allomyces macrogynus (strain ATCC 38327) TaxID=578462 RepID=A0A0L0S101_ALLM3|nr:hypothetical protein AMAG_01899 [Allomyces macrogynus ATCC 38327]|eukprot:KNE56056.1 hypothetical protein AMAG_01899 [Allomyces macrogynus ATCC 38327]
MVATRRRSGHLVSAPTPASPAPAPPPHAFGPGSTPSRKPVNSKGASENEENDDENDSDDEGSGSSDSHDNGPLHTTAATPTTTAGGRLRDLTAPSSKRPRLAYTPAPHPDLPASDDDDPDPLGTALHTLTKKSWGRVQSWFDAIATKYAHEFEDDAEIDFTERVVIDPHELWDTVDPAPLVFGNLSGLAPDEEDEEGEASGEEEPDVVRTTTTAPATPLPPCGALYDADLTPIGDAVPRYTNVVTVRRNHVHRPHRFRPAPIDPPVHALLPLERTMSTSHAVVPSPPAPQYDEDMNPLPGVELATPRLVVKLTPGRAYTPGSGSGRRRSRSHHVKVDVDGVGARAEQAGVGAMAVLGSPCPTRDLVDSEERRTSAPLPPISPSLRRKRSRIKMESVK